MSAIWRRRGSAYLIVIQASLLLICSEDLLRKTVIAHFHFRHKWPACGCAEPRLMSAGRDNAVRQWLFDNADGRARLLRFRAGHSAPPGCLSYYGDGSRLLSAGAVPPPLLPPPPPFQISTSGCSFAIVLLTSSVLYACPVIAIAALASTVHGNACRWTPPMMRATAHCAVCYPDSGSNIKAYGICSSFAQSIRLATKESIHFAFQMLHRGRQSRCRPRPGTAAVQCHPGPAEPGAVAEAHGEEGQAAASEGGGGEASPCHRACRLPGINIPPPPPLPHTHTHRHRHLLSPQGHVQQLAAGPERGYWISQRACMA